jgi:starvation-inducible DNA-binding protein
MHRPFFSLQRITDMLHSAKTDNAKSKSSALATPVLAEHDGQIQKYGQIVPMPLGLSRETRLKSVNALNLLLADTASLRDLYKKHHWQVSGPTFYQLHLLFDKHYNEQSALVDQIAERIQLLGGISIAMAHDIAELTRIARPPRGRETVPVQISRLLEAHELILRTTREAAEDADEAGDCGTNDLFVSNVVRTNELQVWFLAEHLVPVPLGGQ